VRKTRSNQNKLLIKILHTQHKLNFGHSPVHQGHRGHRYRTIFCKRLIQGLVFFNAYSKIKNPKVGSFLRAPEDLEGLRIQKNLIFQNAQIKV
jgi:hypothetical protein